MVVNLFAWKSIRYYLPMLLLTLALPSLSEAENNWTTSTSPIELKISQDKGSQLQLEVRQAQLVDILEQLSKQTSVPIHYSVLPEGLMTATCVGESIKPVLECLLRQKADVIFRYVQGAKDQAKAGMVAEAWVLGSKLEVAANKTCPEPTESASLPSTNKQKPGKDHVEESESAQIQRLLNATKSKNPAERAEAVGGLLGVGSKDDPAIKKILEDALHDENSNVRAQAISTLSRREGEESSADALQEALHDSSVDVRLMAVDSITSNTALLQQAANDSDEMIRSLALSKLEQLQKKSDED